jgi:hypothetical protein
VQFELGLSGPYWWCSPQCKKRAHGRSGGHGSRVRRLARGQGLKWPRYEIVGKFELYDAYGGLCGYCGQSVDFNETWFFAHVSGVASGGAQTRKNLAVVHQRCELEWNESLRP